MKNTRYDAAREVSSKSDATIERENAVKRPEKLKLHIESAVGEIRRPGNNVFVFRCSECSAFTVCQRRYLSRHSGQCRICVQRKEPTLTFAEFLKFTTIGECHYCDIAIDWKPYRSTGKSGKIAYYLDRKNPKIGYVADNLVVCCSLCNYTKSDKFTYAEFLLLAPGLRQIARAREAEAVQRPRTSAPESLTLSEFVERALHASRKIKAAHGTRSRYSSGCRCDQCREANRKALREYRQRNVVTAVRRSRTKRK